MCRRLIGAEEAVGSAFRDGQAYHVCSAVCRALARAPQEFPPHHALPPA